FPFEDVSTVDVILLLPDRRICDGEDTSDVYGARVGPLIQRDVDDLRHRLEVWGIRNDRIASIHHDDDDPQSGYRDLLAFLGVDNSAEVVAGLFAPRIEQAFGAD